MAVDSSSMGMIKMLNSPIITMGMVFGSMQLLRRIDLTEPKTLLILRASYITSQVLLVLFWFYVRSKINAKRTASKKKSDSGKPEEWIEVTEPAVPFSGEGPKKTRVTVTDYDLGECGKQLQQVIVGTLIMLVVHFWFGVVQPLFLQVILPWKSVLTQPIILIHVFNMPAEGQLKRPFAQPNPLGDLMGTNDNAADAAAPAAPAAAAPAITEVPVTSDEDDDDADDSAVSEEESDTGASVSSKKSEESSAVHQRKAAGRQED